MDEQSLAHLGWNARWHAHWEAFTSLMGTQPGEVTCWRVAQVARASVLAVSDLGSLEIDLSVPGNCRESEEWPPLVGDWIVVSTVHGVASIRAILPRRTYLERPASAAYAPPQPMAANVDVIGIVEPLVPRPSAGRVERLAAIGRSAGVEVVLVLTKSDLVTRDQACEAATECAASVDEVIITTTHDPMSFAPVADLLRGGRTLALLGRSGSGKSTLTNALTGATQVTHEVRFGDGKGRHTTTSRDLLVGSDGVVIDMPGVREVAATADRRSVDATFPEVAELAADCRFSDCTHSSEPGCAVRRAVEEGLLNPDRVARFIRMSREAQRRGEWDRRLRRSAERTSTRRNTAGRRGVMALKGRGN